jgi:presenilin-like A22 family membrane protease
MVLTLTMGLYTAVHQKVFVEAQGIVSPEVSAAPAIGYFLGVVLLMAFVFSLVPVRRLRWVFRGLFTVMYSWGVFVMLWLVWPSHNVLVVCAAAVASGIAWLLWTRIWLQDTLLSITLAAGASVFGFFFSPLPLALLMCALSVYDLLAVRFGFMTWIADKLSESTTLPAFIFPKTMSDLTSSVRSVSVGDMVKTKADNREYTILGGGDIAFPAMLSVAVFFQTDLPGAIVVGAFSLVGLLCALLIQATWLKGKAMPALPPIAGFSFAGLLFVRVVMT